MSYCIRRYAKNLLRLSRSREVKKGVHFFRQSNCGRESQANSISTQVTGLAQPMHIPVMQKEVLELLAPSKGNTVIDMTFGGGGHSRTILQRAPGVRLVAVDRDPLAFQLSQSLSWELNGNSTVIPVLGRFSELHQHLSVHGIEEGTVDGILFDLGASSMQFDTAKRGFSINKDGPLDMRMDGDRFPDQPTAADVINHLDVKELSLILKEYGEEKRAKEIAQAIIEARYAFGNISRTLQLAKIVDAVFEGNYKKDKLQRRAHPATKVFQALRIFVNNEINELHNGLELAWRYLRPQGCCVVISFHSLEDRIVKRHFHGIEMDAQANMTVGDHHRNPSLIQPLHALEELLGKKWEPVSKKVTTPSFDELACNPRCRSAKLRAAVKL